MKTIEIAKASNDQLDWLVSTFVNGQPPEALTDDDRYSTSYALAGPLMDEYTMQVGNAISAKRFASVRNAPSYDSVTGYGDTSPQAICRAAMLAVHGTTATVPKELT